MHFKTMFGVLAAAAAIAGSAPAHAQYGPDTCRQGYVWREAIPSDHVCVPPHIRSIVAQENRRASSLRNPTGPYGSDTCVNGYVWREAFPGDHVCVTPQRRNETRHENHLGPSRRASAGNVQPQGNSRPAARKIGSTVDRCSSTLYVQTTRGLTAIPRGVWRTVEIIPHLDGSWSWRCGRSNERSRIAGGPTRLRVFHDRNSRKISWHAYR